MPEYSLKELIAKVKEKKGEEAAEAKKPEKKPQKPGVELPKPAAAKAEMPKVLVAAQPAAEMRTLVAGEKPPQLLPAPAPAEEAAPVPQKSAVEEEIEKTKKIEIAAYGETKIYKVPGKPLLYYFVPVPRPTASEKLIINTIKEAATRVISIAPYKIRDPQQRRNVYYQKIMEILKASPELNIPERRFDFYANAVVREMVGYGIIDSLIYDDKLEEIMVIGPRRPVYIFHRDYEMMITNIEFYSDNEVQDLINRIARNIGRRVDISSPLLDARLPDGSRVNATIPPASVAGSTLTIRKFRTDPYSIIDLINMGTMGTEVAAFLWVCSEGLGTKPANMLLAGGTGCGKTTLLNVLASFIPPYERILTIEDTAELHLPLEHWIRMEARPPSLEGKGEITLDALTKNALRMRPDRIIVGEVRGDEGFTLFTAINTGHDGSMGTVHANSSQETLVRITSPPMSVPEVMLSALDFIVMEHRIHDKKKGTIRRVTEIAEVGGVLGGKAHTQTLYEWDPVTDSTKRTTVPSNFLRELEKFTGMSRKQIEDELAARERFLKKLADSGIRSLSEVSRACFDFISQRKGE